MTTDDQSRIEELEKALAQSIQYLRALPRHPATEVVIKASENVLCSPYAAQLQGAIHYPHGDVVIAAHLEKTKLTLNVERTSQVKLRETMALSLYSKLEAGVSMLLSIPGELQPSNLWNSNNIKF